MLCDEAVRMISWSSLFLKTEKETYEEAASIQILPQDDAL